MNRSERAQPESSGGHLQELSRTRPILHVNSATAQTWVAIKRRIARPSQWPEANDLTKSIFSCNHHVAVRREIFRGLHRPVRPHCCNGALPKIQRCSQFKDSENATSLLFANTLVQSHRRKNQKPEGLYGGSLSREITFRVTATTPWNDNRCRTIFRNRANRVNRDVNIGEPSHSRSGVLLSPSLAETDARAIEQM